MDLTPLPLSRREAHYEHHINGDANENAEGASGFSDLVMNDFLISSVMKKVLERCPSI